MYYIINHIFNKIIIISPAASIGYAAGLKGKGIICELKSH